MFKSAIGRRIQGSLCFNSFPILGPRFVVLGRRKFGGGGGGNRTGFVPVPPTLPRAVEYTAHERKIKIKKAPDSHFRIPFSCQKKRLGSRTRGHPASLITIVCFTQVFELPVYPHLWSWAVPILHVGRRYLQTAATRKCYS